MKHQGVKLILATAAFGLPGCSTIPPELAGRQELSFESTIPYVDAYRTISRQFTSCKRAVGLFGNGFDVQSDLDTAGQLGRIDYYYHGLRGAKDPNKTSMATTTLVKPNASGGSTITVSGTTDKYVYSDMKSAEHWLSGKPGCVGK